MRVVVITSCTASKRDHGATAAHLYTGRQHVLAKEAIWEARQAGLQLDWWIVSAKFGLLAEDTMCPTYNQQFPSSVVQARVAGEALRLPRKLAMVLRRSVYDAGFILLGRDYQAACHLPEIQPSFPTTLYAPSKELVWPPGAYAYAKAGNKEAKELGGGSIAVKAKMLRRDLMTLARA